MLSKLPDYDDLIPAQYPRLQGDVVTLADDRVFGFQEYRFWHDVKDRKPVQTSSPRSTPTASHIETATETSSQASILLKDDDTKELVVFLIPGLPGSRFFHHPDLSSRAETPPFEDDDDRPRRRNGLESASPSRAESTLKIRSHSRSGSSINSDPTKRLVRLFVLERPGIGLSTPSRRGFLDFASDVREFCHNKAITRFSLIAYSAGGPFGLAVAHQLGRPCTESPLCVKAAIISSTAPHIAPGLYHNMPLKFKLAWFLARYAPGVLAWLVYAEARKVLRDPLKASRDARLEACLADQEYLKAHPETERMFLESMLEMYTRGQVSTECWEYELWGREWGFRLDEIGGRVAAPGGGKEMVGSKIGLRVGSKAGSKADVRSVRSKETASRDESSISSRDESVEGGVRVKVWHGEEDGGTTLAMGKYIAEQIPDAEASYVPGKGHYLYFEVWDEVLDWFARG
ncbi:Alpha/Beta hydrolase protein [Jimgerdemannia flammicorona]|uniref:Alpha/Beta hydrolase protein n=1 Tax=Jimgerdemannia flammicorona TaxID=994334 RepID=A0A433PEP8_9FUNG|nr:Alpha/Beta hydrolase protein [Jimgerdemannia flammicorona]